jgi:hypothetical protein
MGTGRHMTRNVSYTSMVPPLARTGLSSVVTEWPIRATAQMPVRETMGSRAAEGVDDQDGLFALAFRSGGADRASLDCQLFGR